MPLVCFQCADTLLVGIETFERHVIKGGRAQKVIYHGEFISLRRLDRTVPLWRDFGAHGSEVAHRG